MHPNPLRRPDQKIKDTKNQRSKEITFNISISIMPCRYLPKNRMVNWRAIAQNPLRWILANHFDSWNPVDLPFKCLRGLSCWTLQRPRYIPGLCTILILASVFSQTLLQLPPPPLSPAPARHLHKLISRLVDFAKLLLISPWTIYVSIWNKRCVPYFTFFHFCFFFIFIFCFAFFLSFFLLFHFPHTKYQRLLQCYGFSSFFICLYPPCFGSPFPFAIWLVWYSASCAIFVFRMVYLTFSVMQYSFLFFLFGGKSCVIFTHRGGSNGKLSVFSCVFFVNGWENVGCGCCTYIVCICAKKKYANFSNVCSFASWKKTIAIKFYFKNILSKDRIPLKTSRLFRANWNANDRTRIEFDPFSPS